MLRALGAYVVVLLVMLALDTLWLGVVAKSLYRNAIGHLMAPSPRLGVALVFYSVFALGLTLYGTGLRAAGTGWHAAIGAGAMFGFFCYATYDISNLATLRDWPIGIALVDVAWGTGVSAISAAAGRMALDRMSA